MTNPVTKLAYQLSEISSDEQRMGLRTNSPLPSLTEIKEMMQLLQRILFPGFFDRQTVSETMRLYQMGIDLDRVKTLLKKQIARGYVFCCEEDESNMQAIAEAKTETFLQQLPEIKRLLLTDVEAVALRDPAVNNFGEVVFSYPAIRVMFHHRIAHALYQMEVPIIPRIISEYAHSRTGIDIHPAAQIGEYFAIDHGTGIVIGETTVIGNHVMLYQGVTLGAKNFQYDAEGHPLDLPRHPIIEDNVTIYSNASLLGRITIGHDSVIGGNIWLTQDVPAHSRITQSKPLAEYGFIDGAGI